MIPNTLKQYRKLSTSFITREVRKYSTRPQPTVEQTPNNGNGTSAARKKVTLLTLQKKYKDNIPISMSTAYDFPTGKLVEEAGMDIVLVGDSVGMVSLGYDNTVPVTMDEMIHHSKAVGRACKTTFKIGDLPFGSYEACAVEATRNAFRFLKEGSMDAVKLEGGKRMVQSVQAIVKAGIPVMGHIGLTPQSLSMLGGFRTQGRTAKSALALVEDALALQEAGCFSIVIECVPDLISDYITKQLSIPTIGIGAGNVTSGQVLVFHDMLGLYDTPPKFCKQYLKAGEMMKSALKTYREEVETRAFPSKEYSSCGIPDKEYQTFLEQVVTKLPEKI